MIKNDTHILLVEDDRLIALDTKQALQEAGYEKITVHHNADDAIFEVTVRGLPDIALLDIDLGLGKRNGFDIAQVLNQLGETVIIFWTAHPQQFRDQATMKHTLFMEKNTSPETLAHNISLLVSSILPKPATARKHVFLSYRHRHCELVSKVPVHEIIYLEADQGRVDFHAMSSAYKGVGCTLSEFEDTNLYPYFFRIHHKYILNMESPAIKGVTTDAVLIEIPKRKIMQDGRELQVIEALQLPISRRQQPRFREFWLGRA